MKTSFSLLTAGLCLLGWQAACPPACADDKPLWLGNPGVDIDAARTRVHERYESAVHWEIAQNLAAYEQIGKKDPRWDEAVRETLRNSSNFASDEPGGPAAWDRQKAACATALANGCNDPLIVFLGLRTGNYPAGTPDEKVARLCTEAERQLDLSGWSPLRKFYAAFRTVQQDMACRRGADGKVGQTNVGETEPAAAWPEGTDVKTAFQHGLKQFEALLGDPNVPPTIYYDVFKAFLDAASNDPIGRTEVLEPLEKFFNDGGPKAQLPGVAKLFEGRFWMTYAWDARADEGENYMSQDQKKRFYGRMDRARAALEEAWTFDWDDPEVARNLITVSGDLKKQWKEIDQWFHRAMDVKPNNYDAALAYLRFLQPNWGGSEQKMVEFGERCFATQDAVSRMPLVLLDVRWRMAKNFSSDEAAYWRRPDVWADVHKLYEFLIKARPDVPAYRTDYAIYAWRAGDWPVAHEQFELVGDKPDPVEIHYFKYSLQQYQDMRRQAAEGVKTP